MDKNTVNHWKSFLEYSIRTIYRSCLYELHFLGIPLIINNDLCTVLVKVVQLQRFWHNWRRNQLGTGVFDKFLDETPVLLTLQLVPCHQRMGWNIIGYTRQSEDSVSKRERQREGKTERESVEWRGGSHSYRQLSSFTLHSMFIL